MNSGNQQVGPTVEIIQFNEPPYDCEYYDELIREDLHSSHVMLHAEKFLELVCDITLSCHQNMLHRILDNQIFRRLLTELFAECDAGLDEPALDESIASLYDRGLELLDVLDPLPCNASAATLTCCVDTENDLCDTEAELPSHQSQDRSSVLRDEVLFSPAARITAQVQCGRYAIAELSKTLLRSHVILTLFDHDSFQMHYYDRGVIAVSSAVSLSSCEGQELFILMLMGLRRLTSKGLGQWNVLDESQKFDLELSGNILEDSSKERRRIFHGMTLRVGAETYTLQEILFRQPEIVGPATCVVAAKDRNGNEVVLKISCPVEGQQSEVDLIEQARAYASHDDGHKWVLMHLPRVIASVDIAPDPESAYHRLCEFLNNKDTKWAGKRKLSYESRVLRITVVEKLHTLLTIASPSTHAQIFFDVLQTHKWLYDHPRILHRDISINNIMFRVDEHGNYFGVLNDFDLASLRADLDSRTPISMRRTGTPPFMAMDLQNPYTQNVDVKHLYRHDLESLFYVILMFVVRHKVKTPPTDDEHARLQLDDHPALECWFDPTKSWGDLQAIKITFFLKFSEHIKKMIKPDFKAFENWVLWLRRLISLGLAAKREAEHAKSALFGDGPDAPPTSPPRDYCEETLGDCITYKTFGRAMLDFGEDSKERLKIRYRYDIRV
ncbi:hypothetical protein CPB85DRAFT_1353643 [Mucidula mucida]|nr:hypothetical protein CPB85DRAFT_1353643 [Mucidula mucida]